MRAARSPQENGSAGPEPTTAASTTGSEQRLDGLDSKIINLLQQDGRMPYREIARQLGVSEGTIRFRANRLFQSGALTVIAIPDPFRLGYRILAFALLKVVPERQEHVINTLTTWDEVTYVSSCTGRADIYMQIVCRDHVQLWELLYPRIPAIGGGKETETFMELKMHKVSYTYPVP
jgi:Lrp/AsnC family transcriptional regulator for asnA, asnC and gidA